MQVSSLVCLLLLSSDVQYVDYLRADGVLARETDGFIAENETERNSRGLPGVNWGLMWFVLLALQAALPSPLNQFPCDYSLMASVSYMCFKQPATAEYKMIRLMLQRHRAKWITIWTVCLYSATVVYLRELSLNTADAKPKGWWHDDIWIWCPSMCLCV